MTPPLFSLLCSPCRPAFLPFQDFSSADLLPISPFSLSRCVGHLSMGIESPFLGCPFLAFLCVAAISHLEGILSPSIRLSPVLPPPEDRFGPSNLPVGILFPPKTSLDSFPFQAKLVSPFFLFSDSPSPYMFLSLHYPTVFSLFDALTPPPVESFTLAFPPSQQRPFSAGGSTLPRKSPWTWNKEKNLSENKRWSLMVFSRGLL